MALFYPSFFNRFVNRVFDFPETVLTPASYLVATEKGYQLELPIPGLAKEDLKVQIEENLLHIVATNNKHYYEYTETLPRDANHDTLTASVEKGMLTITMERFQKKKNVKQIPIT